jgi:hypothetical protein
MNGSNYGTKILIEKNEEKIYIGTKNGEIFQLIKKTNVLEPISKNKEENHKRKINDMVLVKDELISCSNDNYIKRWNLEKNELIDMIKYETPIKKIINQENEKKVYFIQLVNHLLLVDVIL